MDHEDAYPDHEDVGKDGAGERSGAGQPHDGLFRAVFERPEHAASELRAALPATLVAGLDLEGLRLAPGSFVDASLRHRHTDVLFTTTWRDRDAYVYVLVEHQSRSDPWMALRMLSYLVRIWERHHDHHPDQTGLPLIVPLVVHQGPGRWAARTDLADLFDVPDATAATARLDGLIPRFRYLVDDLAVVDSEALRARPLTPAAAITQLVLAHARTDANIAHQLRQWIDELRRLAAAPDGLDVLVGLLTYLWRTTEIPEQELFELAASISPQAEEAAMTTAEKLRREGEARGEARGRAAMLTEQLAMKFGTLDQRIQARIATATPGQLSTWSARLIDGAASVEEIFNTD